MVAASDFFTFNIAFREEFDDVDQAKGRGLHSSISQLNMSRF